MHGKLLSEITKKTKLADAAGAATSDVTSAEIDMEGWDGVMVFTSYGTPAADNLMHAEAAIATGGTFQDIAGSEMDLEGASDEDQVLDIYRPPRRFVRIVAQRGTSSTLENIWAIQYGPRNPPQDDTLAGTLVEQAIVEPAIGTK